MMWNFKQQGNKVALVDDQDRMLTYLQLEEEIQKQKEHITPRSLVFLLCDDTLGNLVSYVGLLENGCVPAMLKDDLEEELFLRLFETYQPNYLCLPSDSLEKWGKIVKNVVYSAFSYSIVETIYFQNRLPIHEDLALLLTTSGSTGSPKFVRQSYKNILSNASSIVKYLQIDATEKAITTLPMNYTYGISILHSHLLAGATILVTNKSFMEKEFWAFFKKYEATSFGGVPYTYEILKKLRFSRMDLPSLRTMTQAGGKLLPSLHQEFHEYAEKTGKKFVVMYGQCEATARMAYLPPEKNREKIGSMGVAIPDGTLEIVDEQQKKITTPHTTGELVYFGENVTMGYAETLADLSKGDERGGVLQTGDMAYFDEDGYFFIDGRKKRFLKIFGNRVNLDEAERLLREEFSQVECACCGKDDQLLIVTTCEAQQNAMKTYLASKIKLNISAFKVMYRPEIPKNEAGKILYQTLDREMLHD